MIDKLLNSKGMKKFLGLGLALSLLVLLFSLVYPAMKRADRIDRTGTSAIAATSSLSTAVTYFAGEELDALKQNPTVNSEYRELCGLLTRVKDTYGYERVYVVYKGVGNKYAYLLDAGYRDNATAGVDYALPGSEFSGAVQSKTRSILEKILSGKQTSAYDKDIVTTDGQSQVIVSFVPLQNGSGQTIAALVVESSAGDTQFNKLGVMDFNILALVSGGIFLLLLLLTVSMRNWRKSRDLKRTAREEAEAAKAAEAEARAAEEEAAKVPEALPAPEAELPTVEEPPVAEAPTAAPFDQPIQPITLELPEDPAEK